MAFNIQVFPSTNDVNGGTTGKGKTITEVNLTRSGRNFVKRNVVRYGFNYVSASGLVATFNAVGEAEISGYDVVGSGTNPTITLADNSTNWVWLQLSRDGSGNVTNASLASNTGASQPAPPTYTANGVLWTDAVLLRKVVTSAGAVTSNTDMRPGTVKGSLVIQQLGAIATPTGTVNSGSGYQRSYSLVGNDANLKQGPQSAAITLSGGQTANDSVNVPDHAGYETADVLETVASKGTNNTATTIRALALDGANALTAGSYNLVFTFTGSTLAFNGGTAVTVANNQTAVVLHGSAGGQLTVDVGTLPGSNQTDSVTVGWQSLQLAVPCGTSVNNTGQATAAYTAPSRDATADKTTDGNITAAGTVQGATITSTGNVNAGTNGDFHSANNSGSGFDITSSTAGTQVTSGFPWMRVGPSADPSWYINGSGSGAVNFNCDAGTGGVKFWNGAGTTKATMSSAGALSLALSSSAPGNILMLGTDNGTSSTDRKTAIFNPGGYGNPGGHGVDSNGDKITFWNVSSDFDYRMGVGSGGNLWMKACHPTTSGGEFDFFVGSSSQLAMSITASAISVPFMTGNSGIRLYANNSYTTGASGVGWSAIYTYNTVNPSDERLKHSVEDLEHGLDFVLKLRPVSFAYKPHGPQYEDQLAHPGDFNDPAPVEPDAPDLASIPPEDHETAMAVHRMALAAHTEAVKLHAHLKNEHEHAVRQYEHHAARMDAARTASDKAFKRRHFGVIAQELQAVLAEHGGADDLAVLHQDPETGILGVDYSKLIMPLVKAVQELAAEVRDLKAARG